MLDGTAAGGLIDVARRESIDMIVVGNRGRGAFGELLLSRDLLVAQRKWRSLLIERTHGLVDRPIELLGWDWDCPASVDG